MGEAAAQALLESDDDFSAYARGVLADREDSHPPTRNDYLELIPRIYDREGVRRQDHLSEIQEALLDEMRETGGYIMSIRQIPLASHSAIEEAGKSGDWIELAERSTGMLRENENILKWKYGNGYGSGQDPGGNARSLINDDPKPMV
jgi:hypothetical protein